MECLDNLIGFRGDCGIIKQGLFYINDLPGFSQSIPESVANGIDAKQLILDKISFSQTALVEQFKSAIYDRVRINSLIEQDNAGYYQEGVVSAESGYLKGLYIEMNGYKYTKLNINSISLNAYFDGIVNVYVYNAISGELLETIPFDCTSGQVLTIYINKIYKTNKSALKLFVCIDSSVADVQMSTTTPSNGCYSCSKSNQFVSFSSAKVQSSLTVSPSVIESNNGTSGISINYSVECSADEFICSIGQSIAYPLLYKVGAELMREAMYSRRLNSIVNVDASLNEKMYQDFENEYMASMSGLMKNIRMPKDICFDCDSKVKREVQIP